MRITKEQLLKTLADISAAIESNDSFEGTITYTIPEQGDGFEVQASYRVGNLLGQGGTVEIYGRDSE